MKPVQQKSGCFVPGSAWERNTLRLSASVEKDQWSLPAVRARAEAWAPGQLRSYLTMTIVPS
jgi:hypothetical protein